MQNLSNHFYKNQDFQLKLITNLMFFRFSVSIFLLKSTILFPNLLKTTLGVFNSNSKIPILPKDVVKQLDKLQFENLPQLQRMKKPPMYVPILY